MRKWYSKHCADAEVVIDAGLIFLVSLCGFSVKAPPCLNNLLCRCYIKFAFKMIVITAPLPLTEYPSQLHSFGVYHNVQPWLGLGKAEKEESWNKTKNGVMPIATLQPPTLVDKLQSITCEMQWKLWL